MRKKVKPKKNTKSDKLKPGTPKLLKLSISKIAKLQNPQTKLCKVVLINNALRQLQKPFQFGHQKLIWQEEEEEKREKDITDDIVNTTESTEELSDSQLPNEILANPVSPYSYNSFLSEVYTAVNNKFKRKISI